MGDKGSDAPPQTTTSTNKPPPYLEEAYKDIIGKAEDIYALPLNQYTGPTLAGFTPDQEAAFSTIRGAGDVMAPWMDSASGYLTAGNQDIFGELPQFGSEGLARFMDPYHDQVIAATIDDMSRANAMQQEAMTGDAIMAGAWGGSGAEDAKMNLAGEQSRAMQSTLAGLNSAGYAQAADLFNKDRATQLESILQQRANALQSAGLAGGIGTDALKNTLLQGQFQLDAGNQQQGLAQQELNIPYQMFMQQQAYPYDQLLNYANVVAGMSGGAGGTTTATQPVQQQQSSTLSDVVGIGLTAASLFGGSDKRAKTNINKVGKTDDGLPIYTFNYKAGGPTHMGLMAQDVEKKNPEAVSEGLAGFKYVDYDKATRPKKAGGGGLMGIGDDEEKEGYAKSYIPKRAVTAAQLNAPEAVMAPAPINMEDDTMDSWLSNLKTAGNVAGMMSDSGGVRTLGTPDQKWDMGDYFSAGARKDRAYADKGGQGPYRFAAGGKVPAAQLNAPGMKKGDDDKMSMLQMLSPAAMFMSGGGDALKMLSPAAMFADMFADGGVVGSTFKPMLAKEMGESVTVPGTKVYGFNPQEIANMGSVIPSRLPADHFEKKEEPKPALQTKQPQEVWYFDKHGTRRYGYDPSVTIPMTQGFADGGYVSHARANDPVFLPGASPNPALPPLPDFSASYLPGGKGSVTRASLNAPAAIRPAAAPQPAAPNADFALGLGEAGGGLAAPAAGLVPGEPAVKTGGGLMGRIDEALSDPVRAGMIAAGLGMIGKQHAPGSSNMFLRDLAGGAMQGIGTYAGMKKAKKDAAAEAAKLERELAKDKRDYDLEAKKADQPEYVSVEGEDEVLLLNTKTGDTKPTGIKPKKPQGSVPDVSGKDIYDIEDLALGMIPGAVKKDGSIDKQIYSLIPDANAARQAAADVYQTTKNANTAAMAYLKAAGIDPASAEFQDKPGFWSPPQIKGAAKDKKPAKEPAPKKSKEKPAAKKVAPAKEKAEQVPAAEETKTVNGKTYVKIEGQWYEQ